MPARKRPPTKRAPYKRKVAPRLATNQASNRRNLDHTEILQSFTHVTGTTGDTGNLGVTIAINPSMAPGANGLLAGAVANSQFTQISHRFEEFRVKYATIQITMMNCDESVFSSMDQENRDMGSAQDFLSDSGMKITHLSADKRTIYLSYKPIARSLAMNFRNTLVADNSVFNEAFAHILQLCPGATIAPRAEVLVKYWVACRGMKKFTTAAV